ncbi:MAG: GNAT family N-acetyltransferase [Gemmatimonadaceae bacterium]|nr:GNAT family N-acetyltransferase [Gemmatimonadaceae bacterium]
MRALAQFERYDAAFAVTRDTVLRHGYSTRPPDFEGFVAEHDVHGVKGMLIYYEIPFTLRAAPTLYIKELIVDAEWRGFGIGEQLVRAAAAEALARGCALTKWQVARWNVSAARFYRRLGAHVDDEWVDYQLDTAAMQRLAEIDV